MHKKNWYCRRLEMGRHEPDTADRPAVLPERLARGSSASPFFACCKEKTLRSTPRTAAAAQHLNKARISSSSIFLTNNKDRYTCNHQCLHACHYAYLHCDTCNVGVIDDTLAPSAVIFATKPAIVRPLGSVGVRERIHAFSKGRPRMLSQLHTSATE